ncbi:hypothetical protein [Ornithinibacillus gellani]|nr:hypothetical protein [Ornithinibacillus gellani]
MEWGWVGVGIGGADSFFWMFFGWGTARVLAFGARLGRIFRVGVR